MNEGEILKQGVNAFQKKNSLHHYTRRLTMFSVITNICNKKTKGPTLMELFTATEKLKKVFLTSRDV